MNPEFNLWCHVLQQAIWDVAGVKAKLPQKEIPRLRRAARAWFLSPDESLGSFLWICHTLSFDPDAVRKRVLTASPTEICTFMTEPSPVVEQNSAPEAIEEAEDDGSKTAVGF